MEHIGITGVALALLFMTALLIAHVNELLKTKKIRAEREKCLSMISRCSQLLRLWDANVYMTDTDFDFLQHRIYKDYIRIHEMPVELVSSEGEQLILAEGFHWTSVSRQDRYAKYGREMNREITPCPYGIVLNMAVDGFAGFSRQGNIYDDLEWIYYMWLTAVFMQTMDSLKPADREELRDLCLKIEKWNADSDMDSQYLKDKIKECREQSDNYIKEATFNSIA